MFDVLPADDSSYDPNSGDGSSSILDSLTNIAGAAAGAYSTYTLASQGLVAVPGNPGSYVQAIPGQTPRVITAQTTSQKVGPWLALGAFLLIGAVAFKAIK